MQATKNNLEDVLSRKRNAAVAAGGSPAPGSSSHSKGKSKPAATLASASARKASPSTLPSFSTPGFGRSRPNFTQVGDTPRRLEVVSISSDSTPSSPARKVKRTSSDPSVTSEPSPQPSKRLKKDYLAEKENTFHGEAIPKYKGKQKELFLYPAPVQPPVSDDDEPWLKTELDPERNPWVKLNRDFPQVPPPSPSSAAPAIPDQDSDLVSKDIETLKTLLLDNHELSGILMERELAHHRCAVKKTDITALERLRLTLNDRISSIKKIIHFRENKIIHTLPPVSQPLRSTIAASSLVPKHMPNLVKPWESASQSAYGASTSVTSTATVLSLAQAESDIRGDKAAFQTHNEHVFDDVLSDGGEDADAMPASEADYWAAMDDVPMDDPYSDEGANLSGPSTLSTTTRSTTSTACPETGSHYPEIMRNLRTVFGLQSFRHNQLEAITEALNGRDVFVLMPTGGGKSLCYQLPAVCKTGKTQGVTVVVSPLLALMKDQVHSLQEKSVDVFLWNSEASWEEANHRMRGVKKPNLLYITPEKLKENNTAQNILGELYRKKLLARFVVDEAHCISTWGQDFREAYRDLNTLRARYPDVPIMALTATARKVTVDDITQRLKLRDDCAFFTQSFNRPNLYYSIVPKSKKWMESMMDFIAKKHPKQSGVIYCLGRDKCEDVAKKLKENGFSAKHFHAGMTQLDKDLTLDEWRKDKVNIIVATIAFGMGIDKADVRFVIHFSLPKSLDGYYQETGRAGRDGKPADCVLYFQFKDYMSVRNMIERPDNNNVPPSPESIKRQTDAAQAVVKYCQDISQCRRVRLLHYFDEKFDKVKCGNQCDNCAHPVPCVTRDVTREAREAVGLIRVFQERSELVTLAQCRDILRGANTAAIRNKHHDKEAQYGSARDLPSEVLDQVLQQLCLQDVLKEKSVQQASGFHSEYVVLGPEAQNFQRSKDKTYVDWRPKPGKASAPPSKKQRAEKPASQRLPAKGRRNAALEADPIELYDEDPPTEDSDNDDNIIANEPPMRKAAPPRTVAPIRPEPSEDIVIISEVQTRMVNRVVPPAAECDPARDLYKQMCDLRDQVMQKENISDPNDILDDETLQYLSLTCPLDYPAFKAGMKFVMQDGMSDKEATDIVERKFESYGTKFLALCVQHKCASKPQKASSFDAEGLRSRFTYQSLSTSSASASTRKSKFKPQR
ncbi:ATP-dependent DNA helicase hus2/rqh1 [Hypsizygus marmoreus]|uniref:DNA 3'-5' helicase n=1 Tax=Hypsizygus marmoreus TaxID=39966 RepID=A0A369JLT1_HYPMA|nr:ATP-dependent DNA helicase hus2/rqh1 [Hypsizygus marmoreus]